MTATLERATLLPAVSLGNYSRVYDYYEQLTTNPTLVRGFWDNAIKTWQAATVSFAEDTCQGIAQLTGQGPGSIIIANHTHKEDQVAITRALSETALGNHPDRVRLLAKSGFFNRDPNIRLHYDELGVIPVFRSSDHTAEGESRLVLGATKRVLGVTSTILQNQGDVLFFPEGTYTKTGRGTVQAFPALLGRLIEQNPDSPVIPIGIAYDPVNPNDPNGAHIHIGSLASDLSSQGRNGSGVAARGLVLDSLNYAIAQQRIAA